MILAKMSVDERMNQLRSMKICRFCLTDKEPLTNIYEKNSRTKNSVPLPLQIMACFSIEVFASDGMPQLICDDCRIQTARSHHFKYVFKKSNDALKLFLSSGVLTKPPDLEKFLELAKNPESLSTKRKCPATEEHIPPKTVKTVEAVQMIHSDDVDAIAEHEIETMTMGMTDAAEILGEEEATAGEEEVEEIQDEVEEKYEEEVEDDEESEEDDGIEAQDVEQVQTDVFPCTFCDRSFPLKQLLEIHMRHHNRERNFGCDVCKKMFFSKYDLAKHSSVHSGEKPFVCIVCNKSFSRATMLHRHEKIHTDVPKYLCSHCDKTFLTYQDLDQHFQTHKKKRPFACKQCEKSFAFKQGLERHELTHQMDKPHKCNYCAESFITPAKLARHITSHAGARPYPCKLCTRTFLLSHHLTRHLRSHYDGKDKKRLPQQVGEHKCDVCSMSFKNKNALINHTAIHSMVNLQCVICNMDFDDAETVRNHVNTHLQNLPHPCDKCDYSFETLEQLEEHELKHVEMESEEDIITADNEMLLVEGTGLIAEEDEDFDDEDEEGMVEIGATRKSSRLRKSSYIKFLKDELLSESEEEEAPSTDKGEVPSDPEEEDDPIRPVVRNEAMKMYRGKPKPAGQAVDRKEPIILNPGVLKNSLDSSKRLAGLEGPKVTSQITTLKSLGLPKETLDAISDKSGYIEMRVGQKLLRVQRLKMTKAEIESMAKQGKVEMKGSTVVIKDSDVLRDLNPSERKKEAGKAATSSVKTYVKKNTNLMNVSLKTTEEMAEHPSPIVIENCTINLMESEEICIQSSDVVDQQSVEMMHVDDTFGVVE